MPPIRSIVLALLVAAAALAGGAQPAHAAPPKHALTIMVTSIEVVDSLDLNACGEFSDINMEASTGSGWKGMNIIPKGAQVEYWKVQGQWQGTFEMCEGATYPVAQTDLPGLAADWESWSGLGLFRYDPLTASNLNRMTLKGMPGRPVTFHSQFNEMDPWGSNFMKGLRELIAPHAGENRSFSFSLDTDGFWGPETALVLRGVISTSATPTT